MIKRRIAIGGLLIICIAAILTYICLNSRTMSFDQITGGKASGISFVVDGEGNAVDFSDLLSIYETVQYREYRGSEGNTARRYLTFLDADGDELFVLTDLGNRNLIEISINGGKTTYQIS